MKRTFKNRSLHKIFIIAPFLAMQIRSVPPPAHAQSHLESRVLSTPRFSATVRLSPLSLRIAEAAAAGDGVEILSHEAGGGVYVLVGGEKRFLDRCEPDEAAERGSIRLTCKAGETPYAVSARIENDSEFSFTVEAPAGASIERIGHRFKLPKGEGVYGLTEYVVGDGKGKTDFIKSAPMGSLDQRGTAVEMWVKPTISIYSPFHINSRGYGLFFDTTWPGTYDLGKKSKETADISFEGKSLPMHFTFGPRMADVIRLHTDRVGKQSLPPKWAAQVFKWRDEHINLPTLYNNKRNPAPFNSQVVEDVMMLEQLGIPTGVYWLDRPWAKGSFGYDDFEFDENRFPRPGEMIQWLEKKHGMKTLLWVAPWAYGKMRDVAFAKRYLAPNSDKVIDLTNPEAAEWWKGEFKKMFDLGVAGFKLDRSEEVVPSGAADVYHDGRTGREMHNVYPMLYARAVREACEKHRGADCLVMPRAGFTGSQKYAVFWGGDTHPSWRGLRSAVISCLRAGLMGFAVWGSDTGGYGTPESRALFSRWIQASAFHPIMEVGGSGPHEPWAAGYEPEYDLVGIDNYRFYAKLHTELAPYNYSYMNVAHQTGLPIARPLIYEWPGEPITHDLWDEWMFGDWILVAPVLSEKADSRKVYLPEGTWHDFWDHRNILEGKKVYQVDAPLTKLPIYFREGAIIPFQSIDLETRLGKEFSRGLLTVAVIPAMGRESRFHYFDGQIEGDLVAKADGTRIEVDASILPFPVMLKVRSEKPAAVSIDGRPLERTIKKTAFEKAGEGWFWAPQEKTVWIKLSKGGKAAVSVN